MQAREQKVQVDAFANLSHAQQEIVLDMPAMEYLNKAELQCGALHLEGDKELVSKVMLLHLHGHAPDIVPMGSPVG